MNYVGIDVASKELSVVCGVNDKHRKAQSFENKAEDFKCLVSLIQKLSGEAIVCMEATGVYHFDLAVALSHAERINVMAINSKSTHNFSKALNPRSN